MTGFVVQGHKFGIISSVSKAGILAADYLPLCCITMALHCSCVSQKALSVK